MDFRAQIYRNSKFDFVFTSSPVLDVAREGLVIQEGLQVSLIAIRMEESGDSAKAPTHSWVLTEVHRGSLPSPCLVCSHAYQVGCHNNLMVLLPPLDLKPWVYNFTYPGARDFSQLALDPSRNQIIVGAR